MNEKRIIPPTPGARLKALRKERHLTQEDVAVEIGIKRNYISEIENGKELPGRETLAAFADFYDVTVDYILKGDIAAPPSPMTPKFVEDPDELALLSFWKSLLPEERRLMIKLLFGR